MKIDWNSKYTTIATYAFIVACSVIIFYLGISQIGLVFSEISGVIDILKPFIIGFSIAYLLNFILKFYENKILSYKWFEKYTKKSKRGLGIIFTYITAIVIMYLFVKFILPQLLGSIVGFVNDIPTYIDKSMKFVDNSLLKLNIQQQYLKLINDNFNDFVNYIIKVGTNLIPVLGNVLTNIAASIWNIILGIVISIYLLIDKEKFCGLSKKVTYAFFPKAVAEKTIEIAHRSNYTFGKFLVGKILDCFILGIMTFVILTICKIPYSLLVSVIIGATNIIPFFGPIIGTIPACIIVLFVSPIKALWTLLIILLMHQIDANIIAPKILGNSIGISAFWILFSILVGSKFLGVVGMIVGVPLFAVIYSIIKELVEEILRRKGFKIKTKDYI